MEFWIYCRVLGCKRGINKCFNIWVFFFIEYWKLVFVIMFDDLELRSCKFLSYFNRLKLVVVIIESYLRIDDFLSIFFLKFKSSCRVG